jgi:hypothetical protein
MIAKWNIDGFVSDFKKNELQDFLKVVGAQGVTWAEKDFWNYSYSPLTKEQSGNLRNNLSYATSTMRSSPKFGKAITPPTDNEVVWIGGVVEYLMRYCLGFAGQDSLGRTYDQAARPILQNIIEKHKQDIMKISSMVKK